MALQQIARFLDLREAQIAQSALVASGISAEVFDQAFATMSWNNQFALGGARLCVPESEAEAARAFLDDVNRSAEQGAPDEPPASHRYHPALLAPALLAGAIYGWPLAGLRRPGLFHRGVAVAWIVLATFIELLFLLAPFRAR